MYKPYFSYKGTDFGPKPLIDFYKEFYLVVKPDFPRFLNLPFFPKPETIGYAKYIGYGDINGALWKKNSSEPGRDNPIKTFKCFGRRTSGKKIGYCEWERY